MERTRMKKPLALLMALILALGLLPVSALAEETGDAPETLPAAVPKVVEAALQDAGAPASKPELISIEFSNTKDGENNIVKTVKAPEGEEDYAYIVYYPSELNWGNGSMYMRGEASDGYDAWSIAKLALTSKWSVIKNPLELDKWNTTPGQQGLGICVSTEKPDKSNENLKFDMNDGSVVFPAGTAKLYKIKSIALPVLTSLSVTEGSVMEPAKFSYSTLAYSVHIPADTGTVHFNAKATESAAITYNGSSDPAVPLQWDNKGQMVVTISVRDNVNTEHYDYTVTLLRESSDNAPVFSLQPESASCFDAVYKGGEFSQTIAKPLTVWASASGPVSYQWYVSETNNTASGDPIEGATSATYTPIIPDIGKIQEKIFYYYCVASNTAEDIPYTTASEVAAITVHPEPTPYNVKIAPADGSNVPEGGYVYKAGDEGVLLKVTFASDAEGMVYTYDWAGHAETGDQCAISTEKDGSRVIACTMSYRFQENSIWEIKSVKSNEINYKVIADRAGTPSITIQPESKEYLSGVSLLTKIAVGGEISAPGGYAKWQWQISLDGQTWRDATEADGTEDSGGLKINAGQISGFAPKPTNETTYYRCGMTAVLESESRETYTSETVYSDAAVITYKVAAWEGKGTKDEPYLLKTAEDLVILQQSVNNAGITFEGVYFQMTGNITLPESWVPIGSSTINLFAGHFDGGGSLLTVPSGGKPLLGYIGHATLSNLDIYGERIEGYGVVNNYAVNYSYMYPTINIENVTLKSGTKTLYSGFIGGYASGQNIVTIRNCTIEEGVVIGYDKSQSSIGAFAGEFNGYIENCVSSATVYGINYVGGIVGDKGQTMGPFEIKNCVFDGTIEASGNNVGGIVGGGYAGTGFGLESAPNTPCVTIQNCAVSGHVTGRNYVGGIFGAEPGVEQCWDNGNGYIQNNLFTGAVTATTGTYVGGIVGYMNSLNRYTIITNNYFIDTCGTQKGIGGVKIIDTSCGTVDKSDSNIRYVNTAMESFYKPNHNRTDDPLGADAGKLTKAAAPEELSNGTTAAALNSGENSFGNWIVEAGRTVISGKPVLLSITVSGNYKTTYYLGEDFTLNGMVIIGVMSDGSTQAVDLSTVTFKGYDPNAKGGQSVTLICGAVRTTVEVTVRQPQTGNDKVTVSFRLIGSTRAEFTSDTDDLDLKNGDYKGAEYVTWIPTGNYTVAKDSVVLDVFEKALTQEGLKWGNKSGNYITTVYAPDAHGGYALSEFTNGSRSGWMYTLNGVHVLLGVAEQELTDGDIIIFHYVDDYAWEVEDWDNMGGPGYPQESTPELNYWNKWLDAPDITPSEDNAPKTGEKKSDEAVTLTPKVTAQNGAASAAVTAADMSGAIADAKKTSSVAIIIAPEITGTAKKVSVDIPKASLSSVASETDADLTVLTPVGSVTLPNDVLASIASQASGADVTVSIEAVEPKALTAEQQKEVGENQLYDISVLSGGKAISSFGGKSITVSLPYTLKSGEKAEGVTVWYLNSTGKLERVACKYDAKTKLATFNTTHLSKYVVGYDAWTNPFTDVKTADWFYGAVKYAVQKELFNGTSDAAFSPNADMTRAMLVTVLYRLDGKPAVTGTNTFTDVESGQWYTDAVIWANTNKIVEGYGDNVFGTDAPITREQMATILYRYAQFKGYDVDKTTELTKYTDASALSSWATDAMKWANAEGLINGTTDTALSPNGTATRAQVATILMRFSENIVK